MKSHRKENKGALYEHPCLLYETKSGKVKTESYPPPPRSALVPPVSGGQSVWCGHKPVVTDSSPCRGIEGVRSPPETGASTPQGGRGWINSLRSLVVTKFATPSVQA